jgi:hypothetical protein
VEPTNRQPFSPHSPRVFPDELNRTAHVVLRQPVLSGKSIFTDPRGSPGQCHAAGNNVSFDMTKFLDPFRFLLIAVSGWMNQQQLQLIDYLREENRVLREQLDKKRLRFNDDQRRRLAAKAKGLGRKLLREVTTIVTPETLVGS